MANSVTGAGHAIFMVVANALLLGENVLNADVKATFSLFAVTVRDQLLQRLWVQLVEVNPSENMFQ